MLELFFCDGISTILRGHYAAIAEGSKFDQNSTQECIEKLIKFGMVFERVLMVFSQVFILLVTYGVQMASKSDFAANLNLQV